MMRVVAALDSVWILGLLFEVDINEDPRVAEARGDDAAYDGWFQEFAALGFVPLGKTVEKCRFFTPLHWNWRSHGTRVLASPDRKTFVCMHRVAGANPLRVNLVTTFVGGGVLETATPEMGLVINKGDDRRIEVDEGDAAAIVRRHHQHVEEFSAGRLTVEAMTFRELGARMVAYDQRNVPRSNLVATYMLFPMVGMFMFQTIWDSDPAAAPRWLRPATLCLTALVFAACRWASLPHRVPRVVRVAVCLVALYIPTWMLSGLPSWLTADGAEVAALLNGVVADAKADRAPSGVDRILARGPSACGQIVERLSYRSLGTNERRALHDILVALRGSDLGDDPRVWRKWCLTRRLGGH